MRKMKSTMAVALAMLMLVSSVTFVLPAPIASAASGIQSKLDQIRAVYPNTSYFTASGGACYDDGGADCSLRNIPARGGLPSGSSVASIVGNGYSCNGFARYVFYCVFGQAFYNASVVSSPSLGDFIYMNGTSHSAIYLWEDSSYYYVFNANGDYECGVEYNQRFRKSSWTISTIYHATNYDQVNGTPTVSNPWIKASKSGLFLGESISFTFGATGATSYKLTIKHLDTVVKSVSNAKSGVSYTFDEEGSYTAYITAINGSTTVNSSTVSFYIVDALDMGSYFVAKLNNPAFGFYMAAQNLSNSVTTPNVYLAANSSNNNNEWKFVRQQDCTYTIVNVKTGYYLSLQDGKTDNGTNICCLPGNSGSAQRWYIRQNMTGYALVPKSKLSSDLSITGNGWIYNDCIFDGANISLYENDSVQSQRFLFEYTIPPVEEWLKIDKTALNSSEKLKFEFNTGYAVSHKLHVDCPDGTSLVQSIRSGDQISFVGSGRYSAYVIHVFEDGTEICTEAVNFYNMQVFDFGQSFYAKIKNMASNYYVAVNGTSDVIIASEAYNNNNRWKFDLQADGSYKISNVATGYVLDLYNGKLEGETDIVCSVNSNSDTQRWFITANVDGYALAPKKDYTKYISVFEQGTIYWYGTHMDGANVVLYDLDNVQSQRFAFEGFELSCKHRYSGYVYNNDATATKDGTKTRTCMDCGHSETVKATGTKWKNPFTDIKTKDFYYTPVLWAVNNGVTAGSTPTTFAPNEACTRGQIVAFLWRAAGSPASKSDKNPFTDVKKSDYYYKAVLWAVEKGITAGTTPTTFAPDDPCTRGQIAAFLWRADGSRTPATTRNPFVDVKKSDYYYKAVLWAVGKGITAGTTPTTYAPDDPCTRGQIVTFLYRYYY